MVWGFVQSTSSNHHNHWLPLLSSKQILIEWKFSAVKRIQQPWEFILSGFDLHYLWGFHQDEIEFVNEANTVWLFSQSCISQTVLICSCCSIEFSLSCWVLWDVYNIYRKLLLLGLEKFIQVEWGGSLNSFKSQNFRYHKSRNFDFCKLFNVENTNNFQRTQLDLCFQHQIACNILSLCF